MSTRGVLFEIAGLSTGFSAPETTKALVAASWATTIIEAIVEIPRTGAIGVDPFAGTWTAGGTSIRLTKESGVHLARYSGVSTTLAASLTETATTATVASTTSFDGSGTIWIGQEAIAYSGKTATTFTGLTRGALGTLASAHDASLGLAAATNLVTAWNPIFEGRRCRIVWYDLVDGSVKKTFIGLIDQMSFEDGGFVIAITNASTLLDDGEVMSGRFARATYLGSPRAPGGPYESYDPASSKSLLAFGLDSDAYPLPSSGYREVAGYVRLDDEIFAYITAESLSHTCTAATQGVGTYGRFYETNGKATVGDQIKFATTVYAAVVRVDTGSTSARKVWHTGSSDPSDGATVTVLGRQDVSGILPGMFGTRSVPHEIGAEGVEIRVVQGNHVTCLLRLLLSRKGDTANGSYDTLPVGWGLGLDQAYVNISAFEALAQGATERVFIFDGPRRPTELLADFARLMGVRVYWSSAGQLTLHAETDVYPDSTALTTIATNSLLAGAIPRWSPERSNLYNHWLIRGLDQRRELRDSIEVTEEQSVVRYGRRSLPDLEDVGIFIVRDADSILTLAYSALYRWSEPCPILDVVIQISETTAFAPGELVAVTLPHLPDLAGGAGLTSVLFEVLEYAPDETALSATMKLAQMPSSQKARLIGPAGEVQSVSGSDLTLYARSASHLADSAGKLTPVGYIESPGTEDVEYFQAGWSVSIIDASSLGTGSVSVHTTTIASTVYGSRILTLTSLPGAWTIATGDIVTLATYADNLGDSPDPTSVYGYLADGSSELDGDAPHVWGG